MNATTEAHVYRFRDLVALGIEGQTIYLSSRLAYVLADTLEMYAKDIEAGRFTASTLGTTDLKYDPDQEARGEA